MPVEKFEEFHLDLLPVIDAPPQTTQDMYKQACSNDGVTVESWRKIWIDNYRINHEKFGPFGEKSIGKFHNHYRHKPCIIAGSGAALSRNVKHLKDRKGIPFISPMHNFAYLHDHDAHPDFYVSLDAGKIVIPDVTDGATNGTDPQRYWDETRNHTLFAYCATDPEALAKWQGEIYFFNSVIPADDIVKAQEAIEPFRHYVSTGGNVTGCSTYIAKVLMGANPIIWVGCNYSFSYDRRFHPWKTAGMKMGNVTRCMDIYGNSVPSWQSYINFARFLHYLACTIPGTYINASEEGILGAYPEGLIKQIAQKPLGYVIEEFNMSNEAKIQLPSGEIKPIDLKAVWEDSQFLIPELQKPFCMY